MEKPKQKVNEKKTETKPNRRRASVSNLLLSNICVKSHDQNVARRLARKTTHFRCLHSGLAIRLWKPKTCMGNEKKVRTRSSAQKANTMALKRSIICVVNRGGVPYFRRRVHNVSIIASCRLLSRKVIPNEKEPKTHLCVIPADDHRSFGVAQMIQLFSSLFSGTREPLPSLPSAL